MARSKTVTALEACEILNIAFGNWRARMWAYHRGVPKKRDGKVITKKNGETDRRFGPWMPTPITEGYSSKRATFKLDDILYLAKEWYGVEWGGDQEQKSVFTKPGDEERLKGACEFFGIPHPENCTDPVDLASARREYRKKIGESHPDKFQGDPKGQQRADERLRFLNGCLQVLVDYNNRIEVLLTGT